MNSWYKPCTCWSLARPTTYVAHILYVTNDQDLCLNYTASYLATAIQPFFDHLM